jgi:oxalate decarboxylase/phosphoglucose isomerase-like protein (cupin superfamily)
MLLIIPQGFGHAIKNVPGLPDLLIVIAYNGSFVDRLNQWVQSRPRYLLGNNSASVPKTTITRFKQT